MAFVMSAGIAMASDTPISQSVEALDSNSLQTREHAATALRAWAGTSPDRLLSLITRDSTPEQRERLTSLARESFESFPRGALGVSFAFPRQLGLPAAEEPFEEGIPIDSALPNFDSINVLKNGDLLRSIDGCRVRTNTQCQIETVSRDKGQVVQLEIEREGRPMRVSVCLGSRLELRGAETPAKEIMEAAWKLRVSRTTSALPVQAPIGTVPAQAWAEADRLAKEPIDPDAEIRRASMRRTGTQFDRTGPDGRPGFTRDGTPEADLVATGTPRGRVSTGTPQSRMLAVNPQQFGNGVAQNRDAILRRLVELRDEQRLLQKRIDDVGKVANDPNLPREQRQQLRQILEGLEAELAAVENQALQHNQLRRNR